MSFEILALADEAASDSGLVSQIQVFFSFVVEHWEFCLLHFLEFAIWGAWFVVLGNLLNARGFSRKEIGRIYACMPIGSMVTPLLIGPIADNYINTEMLIATSHIAGGVLLFLMAKSQNARPFYWATLIYALCFSPTLGLVNSIVFANNEAVFGGEAETYFPWIRVFGTIGWIVAGLSHAFLIKKDEPVNEKPLLLACVLSFVLGAFALLFMPETKPPAVLKKEAAAAKKEADAKADESKSTDESKADAEDEAAKDESDSEKSAEDDSKDEAVAGNVFTSSFQLLLDNPIFFGVTFLAAIGMGLYFAFAALFLEKTGVGANRVGPVMTIGQWIEIFFMLTLPWFLGANNVNMNWVLLIGISAWAVRFAVFAIGKPMAMVLFGIAIHGICFDFFFAAGMINAEMVAPSSMTATAQTLYAFLVYGLGMYIGSEGAGWLNERYTTTEPGKDGTKVEVTNWRMFWAVPAVVMALGVVLFLVSILLQTN